MEVTERARQPHLHTMVDPLLDLVVADFGNAPIYIMSTERSILAIRSFVKSAAEVEIREGENVTQIIVGGDHSLMYPDVAALTDIYHNDTIQIQWHIKCRRRLKFPLLAEVYIFIA